MRLQCVGRSDYYDPPRCERRKAKGLTFRRKQQIVFSVKAIEGMRDPNLEVNAKIFFMVENLPSFKRYLMRNQSICVVEWFRVAFAGTLYVGAKIAKKEGIQYVYTFEDFKAAMGELNVDYKPLGTNYNIEDWAVFNMIPNDGYKQELIDHHIFVAVGWNRPYMQGDTWLPNTIVINEILKDLDFDKVVDKDQAYQTLSKFIDESYNEASK